jgi:hypothetical protein
MTEIAEKAGTSGQNPDEKREPIPTNWEEREAASTTTAEAMETGAPAAAAAEIGAKRARDEAEESGEEEAPTRTKVLIRGAKAEAETPKKTGEKSGDTRQLQPGQCWRIEAARRRIFTALKKIRGHQQGNDGEADLSTGRPASGPRSAGRNPGGGKRHAHGGRPGKRGACVAGETAADGGHSRERHERTVSEEAGPATRGSGQGSWGGATSEEGGPATDGAMGNRRENEGREENPGRSDQGGPTEGAQSKGAAPGGTDQGGKAPGGGCQGGTDQRGAAPGGSD